MKEYYIFTPLCYLIRSPVNHTPCQPAHRPFHLIRRPAPPCPHLICWLPHPLASLSCPLAFLSGDLSLLVSVWGQEVFCKFRVFYFASGVQLKGMGESFLLSGDEPLTPNIDGVVAL